ncbi:aureocin A53 family class IId bacteriocin [Microbacterium sp. NPDC058269]|uniref:aureocin A53 family class IId bacteriocin n=1 Tax=Microbacterium sp. NPDC058269 TaxID=3346414 RepID=UPI0036DBEED5
MLSFLAKIGGAGVRVVNWARNNWGTVQKWIDAGKSIDWIIRTITSIISGG